MRDAAIDFWERALQARRTAEGLAGSDPDGAASRAYYAAFNAVSAWFALDGRSFPKHSALEAAVHRDLVKSGLWAVALGAAYSQLARLRETGDYGGGRQLSTEEARLAVEKAATILHAVHSHQPDIFSLA